MWQRDAHHSAHYTAAQPELSPLSIRLSIQIQKYTGMPRIPPFSHLLQLLKLLGVARCLFLSRNCSRRRTRHPPEQRLQLLTHLLAFGCSTLHLPSELRLCRGSRGTALLGRMQLSERQLQLVAGSRLITAMLLNRAALGDQLLLSVLSASRARAR